MSEQLEKQEIVVVEYNQPKFWHRVMANLLDILIFILSVVLIFIITRAIITATPDYKNKSTYIDETRLNSELYVKDERSIISIVDYLDENKNFAPSVKNLRCQSAISGFISYINDNFGATEAEKIQKNYDDYRLDDKLTFEGVKYFALIDGEIKYNPDCQALARDYYKNVYQPFAGDICQSYLLSVNTQYAKYVEELSHYLLWLEIPVSYVIGAILTYLVPPIFFKRGRQTFGKAIYHIGLIDKRLLSPKFNYYLLRFTIFLFAELILSLFTFGLPFIISFSMMAFSKRRQGFPDYMLTLLEIDASKNRIFMDHIEAELALSPIHKDPIDFNLINKE